jgi:hypothetical protein
MQNHPQQNMAYHIFAQCKPKDTILPPRHSL